MAMPSSRRRFMAGSTAALFLPIGAAVTTVRAGTAGDAGATDFQQVDAAAFRAAIEDAPLSAACRGQLGKYGEALWSSPSGAEYRVRYGDLVVDGDWSVPSLYCLIVGHVAIKGLCDLQNPPGFDEGGAFVVVGSVRCRAVANLAGGKIVMIDGDLLADEAVLNDAEGSAMIVTGDLKTRWYQGIDIWAEVGGGCEIDYGDGYCLALNYTDTKLQSTWPRHGDAASLAVLDERLRRQNELSRALAMRDVLKRGGTIFARGGAGSP